ncbi:MAG: hypothetical protein ACOYUZ_01125 [Patescibacteria group bacterium]
MNASYKVVLHRSHFDQLAIGAVDAGPDSSTEGMISQGVVFEGEVSPVLTKTGWRTRFDGMQNASAGNECVAIYGEFTECEDNEGFINPKVITLWRRGYKGRHQRLEIKFQPNPISESMSLTGGQDLEIWLGGAEAHGWQEVSNPPEHVVHMLDKIEQRVLALFGQGGDFFNDPS